MPAHKHAALMALYAQDAAETDKPWLRWENRNTRVGWPEWSANVNHPEWNPALEYRRKPRTIRIGEFEVPEPLREAPADGTFVYYPNLQDASLFGFVKWTSHSFDKQTLSRGLAHLTCEAAEQHARALLSFTKG